MSTLSLFVALGGSAVAAAPNASASSSRVRSWLAGRRSVAGVQAGDGNTPALAGPNGLL